MNESHFDYIWADPSDPYTAVLLFRCFWSKWLIRYLLLEKKPHPFN